MKYVIVLGDGMADYPLAQLNQRTPLQAAKKPNIDFLARNGEVGLVQTIPEGIAPGSDVANLSVMGYNPKKYYTGRSPLEAVSMGIELSDTDVALRCNLVTLSAAEKDEERVMIDYSSDEITTEESGQLIAALQRRLGREPFTFYAGISYRHCLLWANGPLGLNLTPPHDISGKKIGEYLPQGPFGPVLRDLMKGSREILRDHPVNQKRVARGLRPANSIWLWGEGKKPLLSSFYDKYHVRGTVVSAVDLIKGIGLCAGLRSVEVEGATGNIHTNFLGKAKAVLSELEAGQDFVYLHIEAPDECGHRDELENKIRSIELIDEMVVATLLEGLEKYQDYRLLLLPDHPTPLALRTHTSDPVPFILYQKGRPLDSGVSGYDEFEAKKTGRCISEGHKLMDYFMG
ncbi:MAG: cofactor-independent phosphoglycerate mutase [Peptococcaceae bacterium]|jgi:2,3-bisphosphoglycerate-independent phosphoglycerate mutase|nr:cofactor-independent phosphoglycerate mutase [Peptococcaceae bacterium]